MQDEILTFDILLHTKAVQIQIGNKFRKMKIFKPVLEGEIYCFQFALCLFEVSKCETKFF